MPAGCKGVAVVVIAKGQINAMYQAISLVSAEVHAHSIEAWSGHNLGIALSDEADALSERWCGQVEKLGYRLFDPTRLPAG
jgi:hypothetical protein